MANLLFTRGPFQYTRGPFQNTRGPFQYTRGLLADDRDRRHHRPRHVRLHQGDFGLRVLGILGFRLAAARAPRLGRHA